MILGLRRGRPGHPRSGGIASTNGNSWVMSCRLALVSRAVSEFPCASGRIRRFDPALRRSVGFGRVFFPRATPGPRRCRRRRGPDPTGRVGATPPAAPYAAGATRPHVASARGVANMQYCPIRIPFPSGAFATGSRSVRRTGSPSTPPDWNASRSLVFYWRRGGFGSRGSIRLQKASSIRRWDMRDRLALGHADRPIDQISTRGKLVTFEMRSMCVESCEPPTLASVCAWPLSEAPRVLRGRRAVQGAALHGGEPRGEV